MMPIIGEQSKRAKERGKERFLSTPSRSMPSAQEAIIIRAVSAGLQPFDLSMICRRTFTMLPLIGMLNENELKLDGK